MVRQPLLRRRSGRLTPRRRAGAVGLLGASTAVVVLTAACSAPPADPRAAPSTAASSGGTSASRQDEVAALLDLRAHAVVSDDVSGWAATQGIDATAPGWAPVSALPLTAWRYTDLLVVPDGDDRVRATALLRYRFDGERSDSVVPVALTFVARDGRWTLTGERATSPAAPIWDLGDVVVDSDDGVLVVGVDVRPIDVAELTASVAAAVDDVGGRWSALPPVTVVLTGTATEQGRGLGRPPASLDGLAAVTSAAGAAPGTADADATSRLWISAQEWARLGPVSRAIVLRHELVHVVTGSAAATDVPLWLEEGAAEVVGYDGSGVAMATAAREALVRVRTSGPPRTLPSDTDLAGPRRREAYQFAHVACAVLVEQVGIDGLRQVYDGIAASDGSTQAVDSALRAVTGAGTDMLTRRWQQRLRALAAG